MADNLVVKIKIYAEIDLGLYQDLARVSLSNRAERLRHLATLGLLAERRYWETGATGHPAPPAAGTAPETPAEPQRKQRLDNAAMDATVKARPSGDDTLGHDLDAIFGRSDSP